MIRKRNILIIALVSVALIGAYLNRAYAWIYGRFDDLEPPEIISMAAEMKSVNMKYAALGDSLTYGIGAENTSQSWPSIVAGKMTNNQTSIQAVNLAEPGATSQDVIDDQLEAAIAAQPDLVTLLIGVNDLHNFVPLETYRKNLSYIISELKSKTKARIILVNLPYLGTDSLLLPPYNMYFSLKTDSYNKALNKAAEEYGLIPVDIHSSKSQFRADSGLYSADSFHPSAEGYEVWANLIYDAIQ